MKRRSGEAGEGAPARQAWAGALLLALACLAALWGWGDPRLAAAWWALAALCGG